MTKKELQDEVDYLQREITNYQSELKKYRDKEEKDKFKMEGDLNLLSKINQDYPEIIRWHANPESAIPQYDKLGNRINR